MAYTFTVDTTPMAHSINGVSAGVAGVASAVVSMRDAVVATQKSAADEICRNVDEGFYILMRSQLSQKLAACANEISAKLLVMKKFMDDLNRVKLLMQGDYNRISARYLRIFQSLDEALRARITQLDAGAVKIAEAQRQLSARTSADTAKTALCTELPLTANTAVEAGVKSKAARSLSVMADNLSETIRYNNKVSGILQGGRAEETAEHFLPVLFVRTQSFFDRNADVEDIFPPAEIPAKEKERITAAAGTFAGSMGWQKAEDSALTKVRASFEKLLAQEIQDSRVEKEMRRLFGESEWLQSRGDA